MRFNRRQFLKSSMATGAGIAFPSIIKAATPWAPLPQSVGNLQKYKVLEIFLQGGLSQWENFWVSHDANGTPSESNSNRNWRGLEDFVENLNWNSCDNGPAHSTDTRGFDYDGNGTPISWGPATAPLWRDDIMNRTRMIVTEHTDEVHSIAGFHTLTGRSFGSPRAASLGTTIQRHFQSIQTDQQIPHSYVLAPEHLGKSYWISHATALGQHPGASRPLALKVGNPIGDLLQRGQISNDADAIFNKLRGHYQDLLRFHDEGNPIKSAGFESYNGASDYLVNSIALDTLLGGNMLTAGQSIPCVRDPVRAPYGLHNNTTHRSLEVAAKLLNNGARHVTVLDGGLFSGDTKSFLRDSNTPYDTHTRSDINCVEMSSIHLFNLLQGLAAVIGEPNGQGLFKTAVPADQPSVITDKISLDDTLILLHTEFNREPKPSTYKTNKDHKENYFKYAGRGHFGQATVALMIGGPVASRGIHGGIKLTEGNAMTAEATEALTTTDIIAAGMMAAGIDPIYPDNFLATDNFSQQINPSGSAYDTEILNRLRQKVFGLSALSDSTYTFG